MVSQTGRFKRLQQLSEGPYTALTMRYARHYLADFPEHGPGWLLLGIALVELARYAEAKQVLSRAIMLCPREKLRIPLGHMGHLFQRSGEYEHAASWYRQAIASDPHVADNHIFLGAVLAKQGRLYDAEAALRQAIDCVEGCIDEAYLNLGLVLRAQERFAEAADCFREALQRDPHYRAAKRALRDVERCLRWLNTKSKD